MTFSSIGADNEEEVSLLEITVRVAHCALTKSSDGTNYSGGMAQPGTMVNVISAQHSAGEFLHHIVVLIGALSRA